MPAAKTKARPAAPAGTQIYAVVGNDDAEVKRKAAALAQQLTPPGGEEFGREIIDGWVQYVDDAADRIEQTIQALLTFPFMGGEKLVWLKSVRFLADDPMGRSETVLGPLEKLAATLAGGLPAGTRFLLSAVDVDKRRSFFKALSKAAKVEVVDRVDVSKSGWEEAAGALVREMSRAAGLTWAVEAADLFVQLTGGDRLTVATELEKLDLYLGPERRMVTLEDVRLLVPVSKEGIVFELGNAIGLRDLPLALALLEQLLFQGESPIGIMYASIIPTVRNLLLVKDLASRERVPKPAMPFYFGKTLDSLRPEAIAHLPRKKDGTLSAVPLGSAAMQMHRYELDELRDALEACLEANVALVTLSTDSEIVLSQLLVKIISRKQARR